MENPNELDVKVPNFNKSAIIHGLFGILEFVLILTSIFIYVENLFFLIACLSILSILFFVMIHAMVNKNPFYYIACLGLLVITMFPTIVALIISIDLIYEFSELMMYFVTIGVLVDFFYAYLLIIEVRHNKYLDYFHKRYGHLWSGSSFILYRLFYSNKEFSRLDKGRQYWQDRDPEEVQKDIEQLKAFQKKFKKKSLTWTQILAILAYIIVFGISISL